MSNKEIPVILGTTREVIGTASILPIDDEGRVYANLTIIKTELLRNLLRKYDINYRIYSR